MNKTIYRVLNYILSNLGWLACAIGAANNWVWIGPLLVLAAAGLHIWLSEERAAESRFFLLAILLGTLIDTGKSISGFISYQGGYTTAPWLAPLWISALWLLFAVQLNASLGWMRQRYALGALLGMIGGPLAYLGGDRLGAISIQGAHTPAIIILAIIWGLAIPALLWLQARTMETK